MRKKNSPVILHTFFGLLTVIHFTFSPTPLVSLQEENNKRGGVLETEDISVVLQGGGLLIKITPMEEEILRYCTEDTKRMYRSILKNQGQALHKDGEENFRKFFVQFRGRSENEIYFDPTELNIVHQGKLYKPIKIIPTSNTFDKRILTLYGNPEMAIYAFNKGIDIALSIEFKYKELKSHQWEEVIQTVEEAKLLVR